MTDPTEPTAAEAKIGLVLRPTSKAEAARLDAVCATRVPNEHLHEHGTSWILMADPEGNEFCVCDSGASAGPG